VVNVKQLRAAGLDTAAVARRAEAGRLHSLHPRGLRGWARRAQLAGPLDGGGARHGRGGGDQSPQRGGAVGFLRPLDEPIDVTVPGSGGRRGRRRSGSIAAVRSGHGSPPAATASGDPPPARTIADLDGTIEPYLLRRANPPGGAARPPARRRHHRRPHSQRPRARISRALRPALTFRGPRSTSASASTSSTSSGARRGWRSRPTAGSTTAARSPSRTTTTAISSCGVAALTCPDHRPPARIGAGPGNEVAKGIRLTRWDGSGRMLCRL